jgi:transposase InsO family protein
VGDITEIPTGPDGKGTKLYLATVIDLYSRRLLGAATSLHPDAELACAAIRMAVATRGGRDAIWRKKESERVIFHTDRGSTNTADAFTRLCRQLGVRQSMGRVGSCSDNAAAEAPFSSLEWEVLSRHLHRHPPGPGRRAGLVLRLLQPPPSARLGEHDEPDRLREHRGRPRSRIGKPSTIRGEPTLLT